VSALVIVCAGSAVDIELVYVGYTEAHFYAAGCQAVVQAPETVRKRFLLPNVLAMNLAS
jgi:hypothetical protein